MFYVLRENLSIKKCTTVLLECAGLVSFCSPPSKSARHWNFVFFFIAMLKKYSDRVITYEDILFQVCEFVTCPVGLSDLH